MEMEEEEWDESMLSEIAALESRHLGTHSNVQSVQSPVQPSTVWSCKSCTLNNEASRATCMVCGTPRGHTFSTSTSTTSANSAKNRKTVQATLSFDGATPSVVIPPSQKAQQHMDTGRSVAAGRALTARSSQQSLLTSTTTGSGLVVTTSHSGHGTDVPSSATTAASVRMSASPPEQIIRRAAGEDPQARTRYLDTVENSNCPEIDYEKAQHLVYPTNYSIRDYQLTIAEKALYHNTLVSLPTGLGKTLIAAVVMYNFYRWFPTGKIVFMAPTKPLVAQQIRACHEIMGIPLTDTAELQGNVPPTMRRVLWSTKRVFFCTPQSLQNDLRRGVCAAEKFVCIVVDEAHRATGNYAYCCVVQEIESKTHFFRVLALSATPGAKFDVIQDVVTNLRISHIESRSADDADVKKYTHARQEEVIVCRLGTQILEVKALFLKCFTPIVQRLLRGNIIQYGDPEKLSSWYVLQARERFRKSPNYASNRSAESDLALLVSLLHAKSLLTGHGLSSFRDQITNWIEDRKGGKMSWSKKEMLLSSEFQALELSLAVTSESSVSASHPKLVKLREVLLEHFKRHAAGKSSTRAIVFTQYRASVSEIVALLRPLAPLLNVQPFIGQGASGKAKENKGQSQKMQQDIVRRFRLGEFNVLVATCIAEEGLDIGEVDLIVSFDALTSPVRMIQRMGRTGRKRVGRVIILVTEGDEEKKLARSASAAKTVSRALTTFKSRFVYSKCPRMLPTGVLPELSELEMKIPAFHASQVGGKNASGAVDPNLWMLSDTEKADAEMKFFPPNFSLSTRNKLYPIVANRKHLLRRRPSRFKQRNRLLIGYSARSLILQSLVRKIHGIEEQAELGSDEENDEDSHAVLPEQDGAAHLLESSCEDKGNHHSPPGVKVRRRIRVATTDAETDSEIGSPWRQNATPSPIDDGNNCDESYASLDMHFSPQVADLPPDVEPTIEGGFGNRSDGNKRRYKNSDMTRGAKKRKTASDCQGSLKEAGLLTDIALNNQRQSGDSSRSIPGVGVEVIKDSEMHSGMSGALSLTRSVESPRMSSRPDPCENRRLDSFDGETVEKSLRLSGAISGTMSLTLSAKPEFPGFDDTTKEGNPQQLPDALSLTLSAESPHPMATSHSTVAQHASRTAKSNSAAEGALETGANPRLRSTRQLQFDDPEMVENPVEQAGATTRNCESVLLPEASMKNDVTNTAEVVLITEDNVISERDNPTKLDSEEPAAFSFALFPPDVDVAAGGSSSHKGVEEDEPSAYSFALLPPLNRGPEIPIIQKQLSQKQDNVARHEDKFESAHKKETDGLNIDQTSRPKSDFIGQTTLGCGTIAGNLSIVDLTNEGDHDTLDVNGNLKHETSIKMASQIPVQSEHQEAEPEQEEEGSCSICCESESYDDDPIVFCDGCNIAVHQFCYGITAVPSDKWFCDVCTEAKAKGNVTRLSDLRCHLCPLRGGSYKRTKCGHWVHVQCFLWIPELHVGEGNDDMLVLGELNRLDPDRNTLDCSLCHSKKGNGIIQCAHKRCLVAFHVSCASYAQYRMDQLDPPEGDAAGTGTLFLAYCPRHRTSKTPYVPAAQVQQKTPSTSASRSPKPPHDANSPSHLLVSPSSAKAKSKFKCFKRLKRKYDASQSQIFSQSGPNKSPAESSPWQKRIKRSKRRRETSRALAAAYIEDIAEVREGGVCDDDEDDYGDDYKDAADDSFINDSSQLLYSQSVVSPEDASHNSTKTKKKKQRHSSTDMRSIYARSLFESQSSPLLLRRGGRQLGALPSQGIIRTCLDHLHNGSSDITPSPRPRSRSRVRKEFEAGTLSASTGDSTIGQINGGGKDNNDGMTSRSSNMAAAAGSLPRAHVNTTADTNALKTRATGNGLKSDMSTMLAGEYNSTYPTSESIPFSAAKPADDESDELRKKIEANRLKALEKLQQRRQAQFQQTSEQPSNSTAIQRLQAESASTASLPQSVITIGGTSTVSSELHDEAVVAPSFSLLPTRSIEPSVSLDHSTRRVTGDSTPKTKHDMKTHQLQLKLTIFVNPTFASSSAFSTFIREKSTECIVDIEDSLEADALLSVRMAVLFLTAEQLHGLALAAPGHKVLKHPRVRNLLMMHKKLIVAVVHDGEDTPEVLRLRQLPNTMVLVHPQIKSLCAHLHEIGQQEAAAGFELPSPRLCRPGFASTDAQGLDANFTSRLAFFRKIPALSLATAISLSFRFKNFAANQVPVHKFNDMHWRRMLPWISEETAMEIHKYIEHNIKRS